MNRKEERLSRIAVPLTDWYITNERAFPWREEPSPYRVWVSEIMLQQTRIEAALPYFDRFMAALPTIRDLAEADEDCLMKLWEGLGYYSRARHLQEAARRVMADFGGQLPPTYEQLKTLPGIGEYTAGAIASIAFGQRVAAVDGNVLRVMARLLDDDGDVMQQHHRRRLSELVNTLVPADRPGAFNQGLMELGETICLPNTMPQCSRCPIRSFCSVAGTERARDLPTRAAPKPRRTEDRLVLTVITCEATPHVLLMRRPDTGLLAGLWELPNILLTDTPEVLMAEKCRAWGITPVEGTPLPSGKHTFSHVEWRMTGRLLTVPLFNPPENAVWVDGNHLREVPLPAAFRLYAAALPHLLLKEDVK